MYLGDSVSQLVLVPQVENNRSLDALHKQKWRNGEKRLC